MQSSSSRTTALPWVSFGVSLVQLICSIAIISLVRRNLESAYYARGQDIYVVSYQCLMANYNDFPGACNYAYSLGSISIFWVLILSIIQCVSRGLWGKGRLIEVVWHGIAVLWWLIGAIVLSVYAADANRDNLPGRDSRNAVVALAWVSFVLFSILLAISIYVVKRFGTAPATDSYATTAAPGYGVQMGPYPPGPYQQQPAYGYPPQQYPSSYPAPPGPYPPNQAYGYPAAAGGPPGYGPQQQYAQYQGAPSQPQPSTAAGPSPGPDYLPKT